MFKSSLFYSTILLFPLVTIFSACTPENSARQEYDDDNKESKTTATCQLEAIGESGVSGTVKFTQNGKFVSIEGEIKGLKPGKHGFHVHEKGDLSDKETGKSAGDHFNPSGSKHGHPTDKERHVGDLGNITADENGTAKIKLTDAIISLEGENSIVGKALVVHGGEDKFTQPSGDSGDRVAFGVIKKD